eukprot:TRINITY_DN11248_c0_g1_i8.p1 TRINITY_DN11248_c0_g1~~TRINITY_DN11248_c0_g1_i8.p1  ORF type:complete len:234 (+),score=47.65 TRINITY_DN11248_c0_g1_i8:88-789(+)
MNSTSNLIDYHSIRKYNDELHTYLTKAAEVLRKLAESCLHVARIYGATEVPKLFEVINQLGESYAKSATACNKLTEMVKKRSNWITRDYTDDLEELKKLVGRYNELKESCLTTNKALTGRKEALFGQESTDGWEIRKDCPHSLEKLLKNKEIAFSVMLPRETERLQKLREFYGYFCNELPKEYRRISEGKTERVREVLIDMGRICCNEFVKLRAAWENMHEYLISLDINKKTL